MSVLDSVSKGTKTSIIVVGFVIACGAIVLAMYSSGKASTNDADQAMEPEAIALDEQLYKDSINDSMTELRLAQAKQVADLEALVTTLSERVDTLQKKQATQPKIPIASRLSDVPTSSSPPSDQEISNTIQRIQSQSEEAPLELVKWPDPPAKKGPATPAYVPDPNYRIGDPLPKKKPSLSVNNNVEIPIEPLPPLKLGGIGIASNASPDNGATYELNPGIMRARLMTGVEVQAARAAGTNPQTVMLWVTAPAVLPNNVSAALDGCHVIASATGSLATERVQLRLDSISCNDKRTGDALVHSPLRGYVQDASDSVRGMTAKVYSRAEKNLVRSYAFNVASGLSNLGAQGSGQQSAQNIASAIGGSTVAPETDSDRIKTAGYEGVGKASERIANYYLDLAEQAPPTLFVGAGKEVMIVTTEPTQLKVLERK